MAIFLPRGFLLYEDMIDHCSYKNSRPNGIRTYSMTSAIPVLFCVMQDVLSERGTTHSLQYNCAHVKLFPDT